MREPVVRKYRRVPALPTAPESNTIRVSEKIEGEIRIVRVQQSWPDRYTLPSNTRASHGESARHPDSPSPRQRDRALRLGGAGRARRGPRVSPRLSRARPHRLRPPRRHAGARARSACSAAAPTTSPSAASSTSSSIGTAPRTTATSPSPGPRREGRAPRLRIPHHHRGGRVSERPRQPSPARGPADHADRRDRGAAGRPPRRAAGGGRGRREGRALPRRLAERRHRACATPTVPRPPAAPRARTPARSGSTTARSR